MEVSLDVKKGFKNPACYLHIMIDVLDLGEKIGSCGFPN